MDRNAFGGAAGSAGRLATCYAQAAPAWVRRLFKSENGPLPLQFLLERLPHEQLSTDMLVQLTGVVAVALLGGLWPALLAAVAP